MEKLPSMVDMRRTPEEKQEVASLSLPTALNQPDYPYGLSISLCENELEKIGFSQEDLRVNDMVHLHCMAVVTSVSNHDNVSSGPSCRVELQITHISAESEDEENEDVSNQTDSSPVVNTVKDTKDQVISSPLKSAKTNDIGFETSSGKGPSKRNITSKLYK